MNIFSFFIPRKISTVSSPYNGTVSVVESMGRRYIEAGGLMQSGKFLESVWKMGLRKLAVHKKPIRSILILGLGGGSFVSVCKKLFPQATIIGVDIDEIIVELGKKYLGLIEDEQTKIVFADAQKFVMTYKGSLFDLVFIDMYHGYTSPNFVNDPHFLKTVAKLVHPDGMMIFNRLYFQIYKIEAERFLDKLRKIFKHVDKTTSYSNMLIRVTV